MMSSDWLAVAARYNRWMNESLFGLAATLDDEARKRDMGAFFKSIQGTFNHILLADRVWLARFVGTPVPIGYMGPGIRSLDQELYTNFDELSSERMQTDEDISAWASTLTPEQLAAPLVYQRQNKSVESPLWWAVAHFFNHQTHHRGQITTILNQLGQDPGVTDLFAMLRLEAAAKST
jgi:uncharacterized damage-inducible protein DinB